MSFPKNYCRGGAPSVNQYIGAWPKAGIRWNEEKRKYEMCQDPGKAYLFREAADGGKK